MADSKDVRDIKRALNLALHDRMGVFRNLQVQGHVSVVEDCNPDEITVRLDQEFFTEKRDKFPSTRLMARLQLALAAGQTDRNNPEAVTHGDDVYQQIVRQMQLPWRPGRFYRGGNTN